MDLKKINPPVSAPDSKEIRHSIDTMTPAQQALLFARALQLAVEDGDKMKAHIKALELQVEILIEDGKRGWSNILTQYPPPGRH